MYKIAFFSLLISQVALADYSCESYSAGNPKLLIKNITGTTSIKAESIVAGKTEKFEGTLIEQTRGLYSSSKFLLFNKFNEPAELTISTTRRPCGRACQKSLTSMTTVEFSKDETKTYYDCSFLLN